jgi:hypothetical protein
MRISQPAWHMDFLKSALKNSNLSKMNPITQFFRELIKFLNIYRWRLSLMIKLFAYTVESENKCKTLSLSKRFKNPSRFMKFLKMRILMIITLCIYYGLILLILMKWAIISQMMLLNLYSFLVEEELISRILIGRRCTNS